MTDKKQAALKLALQVLEQLQGGCTDHDDGTVEAITVWCPEVITAIKEALAEESSGTEQPAQPQQEPNILGLETDSDQLRAELRNSLSWGMVYGPLIPAHQWDEMREMQIETSIHRLNAATKPRPDAVVTSLVAGPDGVIRAGLDRQLPLMTEVYTSPPAQRKPLTKEQMYELSNKANDDCMRNGDSQAPWSARPWTYHFVRAIEAAHGIKGETK